RRMQTTMSESTKPVGRIAASPVVYRVYQLYRAISTASTLPPACHHASFKARILGSAKKSIRPKTAARAAMIMPAPNSHMAPVAQNASPVRQKAKSHRNVKTKNAIGKGISIGCRGWPVIEAVLFGLGVVEVGIGESPPPEKRCLVARYKCKTYLNVPPQHSGELGFYLL